MPMFAGSTEFSDTSDSESGRKRKWTIQDGGFETWTILISAYAQDSNNIPTVFLCFGVYLLSQTCDNDVRPNWKNVEEIQHDSL